jgi:hypothetical protein
MPRKVDDNFLLSCAGCTTDRCDISVARDGRQIPLVPHMGEATCGEGTENPSLAFNPSHIYVPNLPHL